MRSERVRLGHIEHDFLPYIKIRTPKKQIFKILIDTGANKNLLRPGILKNTSKIESTQSKNVRGTFKISTKGKIKLLGPDFPELTFYELDFHPSFDGLIGSETLSRYKAEINYEKKTIVFNSKTIPFFKHFIKKEKTFNHIVTLKSNKDGDWLVGEPTELYKNILIEPGIYKSVDNKTSFLVRTNSKEPPKLKKNIIHIKVNNFETRNFFSNDKHPPIQHVEKLENLIRTDHLSILEKKSLIELINKHKNVILKENEKLTSTTKIKHKIQTSHEKPIYTKTYRYPHAHKQTVKDQIEDMLENGIITHSDSPWNAPIWVVPKKPDASGKKKFRVVIDYRKLNEVTVDDKFPIPQIEDILDNLGKSTYFTTLDLKSGFHQIEMDENSRQKTAFSTDLGHYEFLRMPFGLKNAPATFQRAMNSILGELIGTVCYVYLDDVIVFGRSLKEHITNLGKVLEKLENANLKIQLDKCEFLKKNCEFLGHVITPEGVKPNPDKIKEIQTWELPTTEKQIKQFLGLVGYYRKFIRDYAKLTKPMTKYLKKDVKVNTDDPDFKKSFEKCKTMLISDPILAYPDYSKPFVLTTDASNYALGAVLSQINEGKDQPVAFASRTLNKHEINYSTTEKEALAIIWAIEKFKPYLYGQKFTLVTDHKPLVFIKNANKNGKLIRWRLELENYDYTVIYKTGKTNVVADALSRKVETNVNEISDPSDIETVHSASSSEEFFIHFTERPINNYRNQIIFRTTSFNSILMFDIFPGYKRTTICDSNFTADKITDYLKRYWNGRQTAIHAPESLLNMIQVSYRNHFSHAHLVITQNMVEDIISEERQDNIIRQEHDRAHRGIQEVEQQIKRSYFFPEMVKKIRQFNNACQICSGHKYDRKPYNIKISPRPIEIAPFHRIHIDIFGMDKINYLTIICAFSKHLQAIKIETRNTIDIQNALNQYFSNFAIPRSIVCDHEAAFTSIQMADYLANLGTQMDFASSSESNGQIEKTHCTLIELYNTNKHKFPNMSSEQIMGIIVALYNNTVHSATGFTPNEIIFNRTDAISPAEIDNNANRIFRKVTENLQKAQQKMERYNDEKEDPPVIEEGQTIFVKRGTRKKLDPRFNTTKCLENKEKTIKIPRNTKRNKNKIKRIRKP